MAKVKGKKDDSNKKAKLVEKKAKQARKAEKKSNAKTAKADGSDAEDVDLDQVLAEYRRQQEQFLRITETVCGAPPRARTASTLLASSSDRKRELLLFGGEYWNNALAQFFNDLHIYNVDRDEWRCITSPNSPLPRSGHAWCRAGNPSHVYLFGGEFSSPKQGTFYHYSDFWRLEPASREWTRMECKGKTPPARSGHRMTYWKQYIILFGGFQDTSNQTKYLADLWIFDTQNMVWHSPVLPPAQLKPDARSSFTFLPHEHGAVLFGGYSRVKVTVAASRQTQKGQKCILKPMIHQDCYFLRMAPPPLNSSPGLPPVVRWEKRKRPANLPGPPRAGATMAWHKGRGIMFGGVHDIEESEEGMESQFFNGLFAWNVERNRFFPLGLKKPRARGRKTDGSEVRTGRRGRAHASEQELLKQLAALEAGKSVEDMDGIETDGLDARDEETEDKPVKELPVSMEMPKARFNAQLAVLDDVLYIYGGTFEKGDREYTLDDLHAIDLVKLDGCREVFERESDDWVESDPEDDYEEEDEDEDEEDETDEDIEAVDATEEAEGKNLVPPSKRTKKQDGEAEGFTASNTRPVISSPMSEPVASMITSSQEEEEEPSEAQAKDDGLPNPRPFESRREFFSRTTAEWQEVLMTSLRWKGIQPESLSIKEIKSRAYELSEEKWWDCREEITALEEEQEAAGVGEVVSLAERGQAVGSGAGRRR